MILHEEIKALFSPHPVEGREQKGVVTLECLLAERKSFLSRKRLVYILKYRIDETKREFRFTEMLRESGWGLSGGDSAAGAGFRKTIYRTGRGPREETIEERSNLFGQRYDYRFDFKAVRAALEEKVRAAGYAFTYKTTPIGL